MTLDSFLAERAPEIAGELAAAVACIHDVADYLGRSLGRHPELATQVQRLAQSVPEDAVHADARTRTQFATEAGQLSEDVKSRWIEAEDPPLVAEIDDLLAEINGALNTLRRPGPEALRATAAEMDLLARRTAHLDGIEQRYLPWAIGAALLFVLGLTFLLIPSLLTGTPLASFWTILVCLGALPGLGLYYARTVLPRSETDTAIDALNREHFIPLGGLYFPASEGPACVVVTAPPPTRTEGAQAREERRRHRDRVGPFW